MKYNNENANSLELSKYMKIIFQVTVKVLYLWLFSTKIVMDYKKI